MTLRSVLLAGAVCALAGPAMAQETGLDSLHAQARVGRKICMTEHFHTGSGANQDTRKQAEREAIAAWSGFTAWEYGDNWGSYRLSEGKRMKCAQTGTGWGCTFEARPCKPVRHVARRRGR
jgi:hypothetical protein